MYQDLFLKSSSGMIFMISPREKGHAREKHCSGLWLEKLRQFNDRC